MKNTEKKALREFAEQCKIHKARAESRKATHTPTPSDIAMLAIAVGDALESAWGKDDPTIDKIVRAVNCHEALLNVAKAYHAYDDKLHRAAMPGCASCAVIAEAEKGAN